MVIETAKMPMPLIPFELVADIDFGLIRLIRDKYNNHDVFYSGVLDIDDDMLKRLLINRPVLNPLCVCMKDVSDPSIMNDYYNQFISEEYDSILKLTPITDLFRLCNAMIDVGILPTILCKNKKEVSFIEKCDIGENHVNTIIGTLSSLDINMYDPIYLKNIEDGFPCISKLHGKNVYICNYKFNYIKEDGKDILRPDMSILMLDTNLPKVTSIWSNK